MSDPPSHPHRARGLLYAALGAIAFSGKAIIVKLSYPYGVDAVTVLMLRMLCALPLFLALSWWAGRGRAPLRGREWLQLAVLGFLGYYLASFLDFAGLQYIGASLERLLLYLNPTIVLALSAVILKLHISSRQWLALLLSYAGVIVVFAHDATVQGGHVLLGSALVLGSALSYAGYLAYGGQVVRRLGALRVTGVATSIACVLCIGQFVLLRPLRDLQLPREVIGLAVLNATLCTFVPVLLVMLAIERIGAPLVAQAGTIGPLSTVAFSILLLGERPSVSLAAGTVLVIAGIWLLARPGSVAAGTSRRPVPSSIPTR